MSSPRISELSQIIARNTAIVEQYHLKHSLALPSFEADGPVNTMFEDATIERARIAAVEASMELTDLLEGPTMQIRPVVCPISYCPYVLTRAKIAPLAQCDQYPGDVPIQHTS